MEALVGGNQHHHKDGLHPIDNGTADSVVPWDALEGFGTNTTHLGIFVNTNTTPGPQVTQKRLTQPCHLPVTPALPPHDPSQDPPRGLPFPMGCTTGTLLEFIKLYSCKLEGKRLPG